MALTAKQQAFIEHYMNPASETYNNATESAKKAGYKGNQNTLKQMGHKLVTNGNLEPAIAAKRADNQAKIGYNYEIAIKELDQVIDNLTLQAKSGNISANAALTQVIREKNAITGLHKQTIKHEDIKPQLDESEKAVLGPLVRDFKRGLVGNN